MLSFAIFLRSVAVSGSSHGGKIETAHSALLYIVMEVTRREIGGILVHHDLLASIQQVVPEDGLSWKRSGLWDDV